MKRMTYLFEREKKLFRTIEILTSTKIWIHRISIKWSRKWCFSLLASLLTHSYKMNACCMLKLTKCKLTFRFVKTYKIKLNGRSLNKTKNKNVFNQFHRTLEFAREFVYCEQTLKAQVVIVFLSIEIQR